MKICLPLQNIMPVCDNFQFLFPHKNARNIYLHWRIFLIQLKPTLINSLQNTIHRPVDTSVVNTVV